MTKPFNKLLIAQDTGSAIKSGMRGDVFFGTIENAQYFAIKLFFLFVEAQLLSLSVLFLMGLQAQ